MSNAKGKRFYLLLTSLLLGLTAGILSKTYREYIYTNHLYDFHLADTLTNLLAVPAACCLFSAIDGQTFRLSLFKSVACVVMGFVIYEFLFSLTFDWADIIATVVGGFFTYLFIWCYRRKGVREEKD